MTNCECVAAGLCHRHGVVKHEHWVKLCQNSPGYFDAWEKGKGPGQKVVARPDGKISVAKNAWHIIHSRYAAAIKSGEWNKDAEWAWYRFKFVRLVPCGSCGSKWAELSDSIDLTTAESAFFSIWNAHNTVSKEHVKPANREITYEQCRAMYLGEQINRTCIVTLATGPAVAIHKVSRNSIVSYADRCGADYLELKGTTEDWWGLEKFRVHNIAKAYDRTLFLDCDLIVKPSCPNLFEFVPEDHVGMHDDYGYLQKVEWLNAERNTVFKSQGVAGNYLPTACNTGVVMCSRKHADIWTRPKDPFPTSHCAEQIWIEYLARKYRILPLPTAYNAQWWMSGFEQLKADAHIVHWANCKNKAREMSQFLVA